VRLDHLLSKEEEVGVGLLLGYRGTDNKDHPVAMRKRGTPVHIPNTKVKAFPAEDTMLVTAWENRWLPDIWGYSSAG
jgi:hypothetical protein